MGALPSWLRGQVVFVVIFVWLMPGGVADAQQGSAQQAPSGQTPNTIADQESAPSAPEGSAFYQPPDELPPRNGDIIWARPTDFVRTAMTRPSGQAWKVLYRSTDATGQPIAVSGTVVAPAGEPVAGRPVVAYAPGTVGMADRCALSKALPNGQSYESITIHRMLQRGWVVAITDYQGLGTPGDHPYVVGRSLGRSVLDSVRAATQLPSSGATTSSPVAIWGYSEGGAAAVWATELQPSYAPELLVRGAAAGGVPANLPRVARFVDRGPFSGLQMMAAIGLQTAYPELQLDSYLNPAGHGQKHLIQNSCLIDGLMQTSFSRAAHTTITDILQLPAWKARMLQNLPGQVGLTVPMFLYHGLFDEAVPYDQGRQLRDNYCRTGSTVQWQTYVASEHVVTSLLATTKAMNYLADRLSGSPPPSNCTQRRPWWR